MPSRSQPSGHTTSKQRRFNVDSMSWRWVNVEWTLFQRNVPAGILLTHSHSVLVFVSFCLSRDYVLFAFCAYLSSFTVLTSCGVGLSWVVSLLVFTQTVTLNNILQAMNISFLVILQFSFNVWFVHWKKYIRLIWFLLINQSKSIFFLV